MPVEIRHRNEEGDIIIETEQPESSIIAEQQRNTNTGGNGSTGRYNSRLSRKNNRFEGDMSETKSAVINGQMQPMTVYAYGVARNRMQQAGRRLHVPLSLTDDFNRADAIVTLKNYYRRRPKLIVDAERRGVPIYVLRANTVTQMENFLTDVFQLEDPSSSGDSYNQAMRETEDAIHRIVAGEDTIDLMPQSSDIRRLQHEMARKANLLSESHGKEPQRRVRLLREA